MPLYEGRFLSPIKIQCTDAVDKIAKMIVLVTKDGRGWDFAGQQDWRGSLQ